MDVVCDSEFSSQLNTRCLSVLSCEVVVKFVEIRVVIVYGNCKKPDNQYEESADIVERPYTVCDKLIEPHISHWEVGDQSTEPELDSYPICVLFVPDLFCILNDFCRPQCKPNSKIIET